LILAQD